MDRFFAQTRCEDLLVCAVVAGPSVRQRVAHELDRRAANARVRHILAGGRRSSDRSDEVEAAGSPVAA